MIEWNTETLKLVDKIVSGSSFNKEQLRALEIALKDSSTVLDLCTGFGNLANRLVRSGKKVYGVDMSRDSLEYATKKVGTNG